MPVTIKPGKTIIKTYKVAGKTLAEIWADVSKKGPKDDGKKVAALTTTVILSGKLKPNRSTNSPSQKDGAVEVTISLASAVVSYAASIEMPALASDKDLSKQAKAEWKRFMGKLQVHENEHVALAQEYCREFAKRLEKFNVTEAAEDEGKATVLATKKFLAAFKNEFSQKSTSAEVRKRHQKLDKASNHGAKKGALLKTSIE